MIKKTNEFFVNAPMGNDRWEVGCKEHKKMISTATEDVPGARLEWISSTLQGKPLASRLAN